MQEGDRFRAVVSEELAERNGLFVGDTITIEVKEGIYQPTKTPQKIWGEPIQLEIAGLFHMNFTQQDSEFTAEYGYMENNIYVDKDTHDKIDEMIHVNWEGELIDIGYSEAIFFVDDPKKTDSVIQEMKEREDINIGGLLVYPDQTVYQASAKPYRQIRTFSIVLLGIGIGGAGIILFLLMKLIVQGRMHEVGVLLSIGMKKRGIIGQMLTECLVMSVAALVFAVLLSVFLVPACFRTAERITAPNSKEEAYRVSLRDGMYPEMEKVSSDEVALFEEVTFQMIVWLIVLVVGICVTSVFLALIRILELEPKELILQ